MVISLVVAAARNNVIGKNNQLLWHLPNDLRYFKNTTWAMPVIMGRKTFESMKKKPLTGRINIIVSRQKDIQASTGTITIASSFEEAIQISSDTDCKLTFVIGGGEIYRAALPLAKRIHLTRVEAELEGDTFFPGMDPREWELKYLKEYQADEKHAFPYSFQLWERKEDTHSEV